MAKKTVKNQRLQKKSPMKTSESATVKKRGRPSKAEIALREASRVANENLVKEELRKEQQQEEVKTQVFPIFNVGQRIQQINAVMIPGIDRNKGDVIRQDVGSPFAFIVWDDGSKNWTHSACLEPEPQKTKKTRKNISL